VTDISPGAVGIQGFRRLGTSYSRAG